MADPKGFINISRKEGGYRPVDERLGDYSEVEQTMHIDDRKLQASRCMDCGIPFCHWACPVGSKIPEWQDALYKGEFKMAVDILQSTNSFPEITGRICPAPCEKSCVLAIHNESVTIRENEAAVIEQAFDRNLVNIRVPHKRTNKRVAIIGSGPAGLSVADLLNQAGHYVTVFEKDNAIGGLLRYGIPDFKLNKKVIDRRLRLFEQEGVTFITDSNIGINVLPEKLVTDFDAVVIAIGAGHPRNFTPDGRNLSGIHFAMDYLTQQNKVVKGETIDALLRINAKDKKVLVIGGGDTGSDCVGTANRQGAAKITQIEIMPQPSVNRQANNPWPYWPATLRTSSSHEEGCERIWSVNTKRFIGDNGILTHTELVKVEWIKTDTGKTEMREIPGSEFLIETDLVFLSMGFLHPVHQGLVETLDLKLNKNGTIQIGSNHQTSVSKIFATGDAVKGASLVVTAIAHAREVAVSVHKYLMEY